MYKNKLTIMDIVERRENTVFPLGFGSLSIMNVSMCTMIKNMKDKQYRNELKEEIRNELKLELKDEIKRELKEELKKELAYLYVNEEELHFVTVDGET